ncbi:uncharacterized protein LAJ45_04936 [Morchella importuna]|uniref:uncharacterized protein n=1 Tax=Morchella importuna TaxID=1174673 RepID=UPI001E8EB1AB|nr:uncharacterized protein LAJ45_04936 [Morchella importuna]KAH8150757.1 hypothetical protein LAJ45_04936 [Morchella importuna]
MNLIDGPRWVMSSRRRRAERERERLHDLLRVWYGGCLHVVGGSAPGEKTGKGPIDNPNVGQRPIDKERVWRLDNDSKHAWVRLTTRRDFYPHLSVSHRCYEAHLRQMLCWHASYVASERASSRRKEAGTMLSCAHRSGDIKTLL